MPRMNTVDAAIGADETKNQRSNYIEAERQDRARDYQNRTSQWTIGKTFDTFAPMGPALVTADEVPDPHNLDIKLTTGKSPCDHLEAGLRFYGAENAAAVTLRKKPMPFLWSTIRSMVVRLWLRTAMAVSARTVKISGARL